MERKKAQWKDKETEARLIKEGKIEGIKEGKIEGIKEGIKKGELNVVSKMLKENVKIEDIMKFTDLSKKEILNLKKMNAK